MEQEHLPEFLEGQKLSCQDFCQHPGYGEAIRYFCALVQEAFSYVFLLNFEAHRPCEVIFEAPQAAAAAPQPPRWIWRAAGTMIARSAAS